MSIGDSQRRLAGYSPVGVHIRKADRWGFEAWEEGEELCCRLQAATATRATVRKVTRI
jgi:hypothetical protein